MLHFRLVVHSKFSKLILLENLFDLPGIIPKTLFQLVKVWDYDGGIVTAVGSGHSDQIKKIALSPDNATCVSVSRDGAIAIWNMKK